MSIKKKIIVVLLALGTVLGFASGFFHVHHRGPCHGAPWSSMEAGRWHHAPWHADEPGQGGGAGAGSTEPASR